MTGRGKRLAQARRLLGVVLERDVSQTVAAEMVGTSGASWSRWESEKDRPKMENLLAFVEILRNHGLPQVTASWIEFGEGEGPPAIGHPPQKAVPTKPKAVRGEKMVRPEDEARRKKNRRRA